MNDLQSACIASNVVTEDDASHARLARARLAHQQDLLLLRLLDLAADLCGRGVDGRALAGVRHCCGRCTELAGLVNDLCCAVAKFG